MTHCPGKPNQHSQSAAHKAHEICRRCRDISLDEKRSEYFICCLCFNLVPYDGVKRYGRTKRIPAAAWKDTRGANE